MTSIQAVRMPVVAAPSASEAQHEPHATGTSSGGMSTKTKLTLGGLGALSLAVGGIVGHAKGALGKGLIGGAILGGAVIGAALLGGAGRSYSDGYCDYAGDPDCDYYNPYPYDPYPYPEPYEPYRPGYPDPDRGYDPGNGPGDSW